MTSSKTYIVNDQATETDALDFAPYVETLADIIQTGNTPLTIGVFGTWGSGKTSLMKMIKEGITESEYKGLPKDYTVAWFDAWKYDKEETLWRSFLLCVLSAVRKTATKNDEPLAALDNLETMLYRAIDIEKVGGVKVDLLKLGGIFTKGTVQLGLSFIPGGTLLSKLIEETQKLGAKALTDEFTQAIQRERTQIHIEQVHFLEQFQDKFNTLVQEYIAPKRLVVFVDDLDRCVPEKAIEVLEAIKLFLDVDNCVFILGLDQDVIAHGIKIKYKDVDQKQDGGYQQRYKTESARYLEKIIQLPFQIPPVEHSDMYDFIEKLSDNWPHPKCPAIFAESLGDNPRQIKRTVNVFLMLWNLAQKRKDKVGVQIEPVSLAKIVVIQSIYPELYNLLKEFPRYLKELENYYKAQLTISLNTLPDYLLDALAEGEEIEDEVVDLKKAEDLPKVSPPLLPFISHKSIRNILSSIDKEGNMSFSGLKSADIRRYFTLARRAESPQSESALKVTRFFEPQMVKIPAGKFLMGSFNEQFSLSDHKEKAKEKDWLNTEIPQHEVELSEYWIGKYPVTNREYQGFVKSRNYTPPPDWNNDQFPQEKDDHPVVNVSWNDAVAYCEWLGEQTGKSYRLPTESEWEKAARGTDGRIWPWGNEFDLNKANTKESNNKNTTEVGQFSPQGDSPYECSDMIGNVWEWCNDWFDKDEYKNRSAEIVMNPQGPQQGNHRVVRGGSFNRVGRDARNAIRRANEPNLVGNAKGFRIAFSSNIESEI